MSKRIKRGILTAFVAACAMTVGMPVYAATLNDVLPAAGMGSVISEGTSLVDISKNVTSKAKATDGLSKSITEMNAMLHPVYFSKEHGTSAIAASVVKDIVPSAETVQTAPAEEETLAAETAMASDSTQILQALQTQVLPNATTNVDISQFFGGQTQMISIPDSQITTAEMTTDQNGKEIMVTMSPAEAAVLVAQSVIGGEENFTNLVIAQVDNYVNVRDAASEDGNVVGKLYNKSVGTFLSQKDGWYEITSGNVTGYVKAEFVVTGADAVELAKTVGTRVAKVNTTTLNVRNDASIDAELIGQVPEGEEIVVTDEKDGWVKVNIEEGDGWVSKDFVSLKTEFVQAESKAEEEARLAREAAEREKARKASSKSTSKQSSSSKYNSASSYIPAGSGSATGNAVAQYALQFVGNPYVYGGTSLTNGADCSGFVMSVYKNFGVSLPHSSSADRGVGSTVGSLAEAQPGDIICYSGHVGIYIGGGQIVHASTSRTGIITGNASYRNILAIRRIF